MGYETHLAVVIPSTLPTDEIERDMDKPYAEGGHEYKYDEDGNPIKTGRQEIYVQKCAEIDMCKIGQSALEQVHNKAARVAEAHNDEKFYYFFQTDGNSRYMEDPYGAPLALAEIDDCIEALEHDVQNDYRRYNWALALLKAVRDGCGSEFKVLFWGT